MQNGGLSQGRKKEGALSIEKYPKPQILKDKKRIPMTIRKIPLRENRKKKKKKGPENFSNEYVYGTN